MAGSGSNSRKGFPEAGGECCQPQRQEEMMYLEGHMVLSLPPGLATHIGKLKAGVRAGASSAWERVWGPLWMAWRRRGAWLHQAPVTDRLDWVLTATLGTRIELPLPKSSEIGSALPGSHCQEVAKQ